MAQPKFVPEASRAAPKYYESPPRRSGSWMPNRPGEVVRDGQPSANRMGSQGPDQGFAIKLAKHLEPEVILQTGEHFDDVMSGCVAVATKRASLYSRAPTIHDVRGAFGLFGFFEPVLAPEVAATRRHLFAEVAHPHHYAERRHIVDSVDEALLRLTPTEMLVQSPAFLRRFVPTP